MLVAGFGSRHRNLAAGGPTLAPRWVELGQGVLGLLVVAAQFACAFGFLAGWIGFFYLFGMLWLLGVATFAFGYLVLGAVY